MNGVLTLILLFGEMWWLSGALSRMGFAIARERTVSTQEAALHLLNEKLSVSSRKVVILGARWKQNRSVTIKAPHKLNSLPATATPNQYLNQNWFTRYEQRPDELEDCTLYEFVRDWQPLHNRRAASDDAAVRTRVCMFSCLHLHLVFFLRAFACESALCLLH
jgi:hypothetical protein